MKNIRAIIMEAARSGGAISFARFMELALYCPNFGYYERSEAMPGRAGDFFTNVSVGPLFGELLAFQFCQWLSPGGASVAAATETAGQGFTAQLVEAGAHDGRLASDILAWLRAHRPALAEAVEYWIIEPSALRTQVQKQTLREFASSVRWFNSWDDIPRPGVNGVIFSNELLDAMPVHRLGWDAAKKEWFEWGVAMAPDEDGFVWSRMALARETLQASGLADLPPELLEVLPDGFTTEANLAAVDWWSQAASRLRSGKLLTIDYGLAAEEFLLPARSRGTLRAYHRHQASADLLARPGEQDLTAHVNFTAIQRTGEAKGLRTETLQSQGRFLTGVLRQIEESGLAFGEWTPKRLRQFQTLVHPNHLGGPFQVLVQSTV